jgi:hypothetical protein
VLRRHRPCRGAVRQSPGVRQILAVRRAHLGRLSAESAWDASAGVRRPEDRLVADVDQIPVPRQALRGRRSVFPAESLQDADQDAEALPPRE